MSELVGVNRTGGAGDVVERRDATFSTRVVNNFELNQSLHDISRITNSFHLFYLGLKFDYYRHQHNK